MLIAVEHDHHRCEIKKTKEEIERKKHTKIKLKQIKEAKIKKKNMWKPDNDDQKNKYFCNNNDYHYITITAINSFLNYCYYYYYYYDCYYNRLVL